jgi:mRNA interferase HigB
LSTVVDITHEDSGVRVISKARLKEFWDIQKRAKKPLEDWYAIVSQAAWQNLADVGRIFPSADQVTVKSGRPVVVFNVGGNKYRLIAAIHYNTQTVFILDVMTHADYSAMAWKQKF